MFILLSGLQGILEEGNQVYSCLKLEFVDESGDPSTGYVQEKLEKLWSTGKVVTVL